MKNMNSKPFSIIVAHDLNLGIGILNTLPWKLSGDMSFFKKTTSETKDEAKQNVVIMGKNTYESIPEKFRPLPNRFNIVLSKNSTLELPTNAIQHTSLDMALNWVTTGPLADQLESIFVIGGSTVYKEAIQHPLCQKLIITKIHKLYDCDAFFPSYSHFSTESWRSEILNESSTIYRFHILQKTGLTEHV